MSDTPHVVITPSPAAKSPVNAIVVEQLSSTRFRIPTIGVVIDITPDGHIIAPTPLAGAAANPPAGYIQSQEYRFFARGCWVSLSVQGGQLSASIA